MEQELFPKFLNSFPKMSIARYFGYGTWDNPKVILHAFMSQLLAGFQSRSLDAFWQRIDVANLWKYFLRVHIQRIHDSYIVKEARDNGYVKQILKFSLHLFGAEYFDKRGGTRFKMFIYQV